MSNKQTKGQPGRRKVSFSSLVILALLGIAFYFASGSLPGQPAEPPSQTAQVDAGSAGQSSPETPPAAVAEQRPGEKDTVFAYLKEYGRLPDYYLTKEEARKLGWEGGSLEAYAPGKMIGGDRFGNFEGLLPKKSGRSWTEADIGTMGKPNSERSASCFQAMGSSTLRRTTMKASRSLGRRTECGALLSTPGICGIWSPCTLS